MREKMIEILGDLDCNCEYCKDCEFNNDIDGCTRKQKEIIVDKLIANDVTFATDNNVGDQVSPTDKPRFLLKENGDIVPLTNCQQWISVKDRLPEQTDPAISVLGIDKKGRCYIACYYKGVTDDRFTGFYANAMKVDVTHWMPLPEQPEGE